jgi:siroheme synthase-like protein
MFVDTEDREILVCGGGVHALEKLERLQSFGARMRVIAEEISPEVERFPGVSVEKRCFQERDLDSWPVFVVAAQDREENERIVGICRKRHVPVNAVDMQDLCDFIFPALITSESLCVGISTGGVSPAVGVELKRRIGEQIPDRVDEILMWMGELRESLRERVTEKERLRQILRRAAGEALAAGRPLCQEETAQILESLRPWP